MNIRDKQGALVSVCFAVLLAHTILAAIYTPAWRRGEIVFPSWMVAGLAWWVALGQARAGKVRLWMVVVGALVLRVVALASWPDLSDDIYRYVWEGELVANGVSPYAFAPDNPELAEFAARLPEIHAAVNHPSISASYPPLTEAVFALLVIFERALAWGSIFLMRLFFTLCDLLVIVPLVSLLRRLRLPPGLALAWAWSPLVVMEFGGSGHFDSLGILLLMTSLALFAAASRRAQRLAQLVLAGAIVVKYIPLAALPFVSRGKQSWKRVLLVPALVLMAFTPLLFLRGGFGGMFSGLGEYGLRWQSSGLVHPHISGLFESWFPMDGSLFDARRMVRLTLAGLWFAVALIVWKKRLEAAHATGILLGAFLVLTPTIHPWYVTWVLPFVALRPRRSWAWLAGAVPLTYVMLIDWKEQQLWREAPWVQAVIAIPFFVLLILDLRPTQQSPKP